MISPFWRVALIVMVAATFGISVVNLVLLSELGQFLGAW